MSKIPTGRLLEQLPERRAIMDKKRQQEIRHQGRPEEKFSRATLNAKKESELVKTLSDTQGKVKQLLEKLDTWSLESVDRSRLYLSGGSYRDVDTPKHSSYRAGVIRKIKNEVVAGYTTVTEILDQSSNISQPENLSLLGEIYAFDETVSTTLTSSQVKVFQESIYNILKPILIEMGIVK